MPPEEPQSQDAFDPAYALTWFAIIAVGGLTVFFCVWITVLHLQASPIPTELWAALTGMVGWLTAKLGGIFDNRFGTTRSSGVKDATIQQLANKR